MKFLLLLLAILGIWWALRLLRASPATPRPRNRHRTQVEEMVACARCGLHVPESEAVERDGRHYCCEEHARGDRP